MRGTLAGRVTLVVTVAAAAVLIVVSLATLAGVTRREKANVDSQLQATAARLAQPARRALVNPHLADRPQIANAKGSASLRLERRGVVVYDDERASDVPIPAANGLTTEGDDRVLARRLTPHGRMILTQSYAEANQRIADLRRRILIATIAGLAAIALFVRILTARALRPLQRLREGAARVSSTRDLTTRLATGGPDEVDDVVHSLNAMLERLQASASAMERFTADAGHELRTPLTALRANVSSLRRDLPPEERERVLAELEAEHERLAALIDALQALARGAGEQAPLDLADVADAAVASASRRHPQVRFSLVAPPAVPLTGDEAGLRATLDNLLENAARHGADTVRLTLEPGRITVDDDGPGIPPDDRERVFERFARGRRTTAPGSGLGLAIVAQQAERHSGSATIDDSPLGGARIVVRMG